MAVIKSRRTDLKDVQGRLRDQLRLCQEETGLGAKWGSRAPIGKAVPDASAAIPGPITIGTVGDLDALMDLTPDPITPDFFVEDVVDRIAVAPSSDPAPPPPRPEVIVEIDAPVPVIPVEIETPAVPRVDPAPLVGTVLQTEADDFLDALLEPERAPDETSRVAADIDIDSFLDGL